MRATTKLLDNIRQVLFGRRDGVSEALRILDEKEAAVMGRLREQRRAADEEIGALTRPS